METNSKPQISSYTYRNITINVSHDNGFPLYTMFRLNKNGHNQILTIDGFRDVMGSADPSYSYYSMRILKCLSLDDAVNNINNILANEEYTALSDRTGKEYKKLMEAARGDINRDELWAAACVITGFKNTRKNNV